MFIWLALAQLYVDNMKKLGREVKLAGPSFAFGSTDMGNVSQIVPGIQPVIDIAKPEILLHSPEFARAAASERGLKGMADAAKALAMIIVDLLGNPDTISKVKEEFKQVK